MSVPGDPGVAPPLSASFLRTTLESSNRPDEELWFTTVQSHSSGVRVQIYF